MSSDFIYFFKKMFESAVLTQNEPCSNTRADLKVSGWTLWPLFTATSCGCATSLKSSVGRTDRAATPTHALVNLHSLKDDVYSLPGQPQDLYCWMLRLAAGFFIVCWMLGVLKGQKEGKGAVVFQILVPCCMSSQEINHISLSLIFTTLHCSDLWMP